MIKYFIIILLLSCLSMTSGADESQAPAIQLATKYNIEHDISHYWISEKLDGVRGYWNGRNLVTKNGNLINAPQWFTKNWPKQHLDGELWIGRNQFEQVVSCVRTNIPQPCWQDVHFMIFDLPQSTEIFSQRAAQMQALVNQVQSPYLKVIQQFKLPSLIELNEKLKSVINKKGEGLMLHYESAVYTHGRSNNIMKLKPYQDAEALVLKHLEGKGKYKNMLGALQVKTANGIVFKIGTGFSDNERKNPPPIGSTITFKYIGKTQKGVPKFASFLRVKQF